MKKYHYYDGKLIIELPDEFQDMDSKAIIKKFPYQIRPQIIKWDMKEIIFTLDLINQSLREKEAYFAVVAMQRKMNKIYPASIIKTTSIIYNPNVAVAWFAFALNSRKGKSIHTMFALPMDGKFLLGSFHSNSDGHQKLYELTQQFLKKIMFREVDKEGWNNARI